MDPDEEDDEDELDAETIERVQRRLASMPRQFSGSNWQTVGALPASHTINSYVTNAASSAPAAGWPLLESHATYTNAAQLLTA